MKNGPTKKQTKMLKFIEDFSDEHGFSPSYREIMRAMSLSSVSAVAQHVDNCVAAGFLEKRPHEARSLKVIDFSENKEIIKIFRQKIFELRTLTKPQVDENGIALPFDEGRAIAAKEDIKSLEIAAGILKIDL